MQVHPAGYEKVKGVGFMSDLSTVDVQNHLSEMKHVYDITRTLSPLEMYTYFRTLERAYMENCSLNNFASTVHRLHPQKYIADFEKDKLSFLWSLSGMLKCPMCSLSLPMDDAYQVHILNETVTCSVCLAPITYEYLAVAALEHRWNIDRRHIESTPGALMKFPAVLSTKQKKTWQEFCTELRTPLGRRFNAVDRKCVMKVIRRFKDNLSSISMDLVKGMYRQMDFVNKICCNFEYWNRPEVLTECVARYNMFMNLIASHKAMMVPTMDIDLAWHAHQTHHNEYLAYCTKINKRVIDHDDTIVTNVLNLAYARTFIKWSQRYHSPYSHHPPSLLEWQHHRWGLCLLIFPYGIYRAVVWNKHKKPKELPSDVRDTGEVAIIGTPVMDSSKRPRGEAAFEKSVYASLKAMDGPGVAHSTRGGSSGSVYFMMYGGGCSAFYGGHGGCGGGCVAGCGGGRCMVMDFVDLV